jgi:hypothetical protein
LLLLQAEKYLIEMVINGKTEDLLVKQFKNCEKKMQELTDSIKDQT